MSEVLICRMLRVSAIIGNFHHARVDQFGILRRNSFVRALAALARLSSGF
jgi:hypothetical protein